MSMSETLGDGVDADGIDGKVLPPPGWYRLPYDPRWQNYWDGSEWMDRAQAATANTSLFPGMAGR